MMNNSVKFFIAGGILSPLVLTFGKLIVFLAGIVALVWLFYSVSEALKEENSND